MAVEFVSVGGGDGVGEFDEVLALGIEAGWNGGLMDEGAVVGGIPEVEAVRNRSTHRRQREVADPGLNRYVFTGPWFDRQSADVAGQALLVAAHRDSLGGIVAPRENEGRVGLESSKTRSIGSLVK